MLGSHQSTPLIQPARAGHTTRSEPRPRRILRTMPMPSSAGTGRAARRSAATDRLGEVADPVPQDRDHQRRLASMRSATIQMTAPTSAAASRVNTAVFDQRNVERFAIGCIVSRKIVIELVEHPT